MKSLVFNAMADGAVGFSTGLQYVPGTYAKSNEIIELARVAANEGGLYATHMRNEGTALEAAVARVDRTWRRTLDMRPPDFAPEGRQPEPLGRQRGGAEAHRRGAGARAAGAGGSIRLHRRLVVALDPISVVGARGRRRACARAARTIRRRGRRSRRRCRAAGRARLHRPVVGDGGELSAGSVAERPVDEGRGGRSSSATSRPTRRSKPRGC